MSNEHEAHAKKPNHSTPQPEGVLLLATLLTALGLPPGTPFEAVIEEVKAWRAALQDPQVAAKLEARRRQLERADALRLAGIAGVDTRLAIRALREGTDAIRGSRERNLLVQAMREIELGGGADSVISRVARRFSTSRRPG